MIKYLENARKLANTIPEVKRWLNSSAKKTKEGYDKLILKLNRDTTPKLQGKRKTIRKEKKENKKIVNDIIEDAANIDLIKAKKNIKEKFKYVPPTAKGGEVKKLKKLKSGGRVGSCKSYRGYGAARKG
jgi:hypothetical protein